MDATVRRAQRLTVSSGTEDAAVATTSGTIILLENVRRGGMERIERE